MIERAATTISHSPQLTEWSIFYFYTKVLISFGVPKVEVKHFMHIPLSVLCAQFNTLIRLNKVVADYSNFAFVCFYIAKFCIKEDTIKAYEGDALSHYTMNRWNMKNITKVHFKNHKKREI